MNIKNKKVVELLLKKIENNENCGRRKLNDIQAKEIKIQ
jgi:hypothetical protein